LSNVNFSQANLQNADFTGTRLTWDQLRDAVSIRDARLPNGTIARDSNLIENGNAQCNLSLAANWKLRTGNVTIDRSDEHTNNCRFVGQSYGMGATMWQRINLVTAPKAYFELYPRAALSARMSSGVSIQLSGQKGTETIFSANNLSKWKQFSKPV
jgi:uncharacterized protein YjbI with pentapeptide repeats